MKQEEKVRLTIPAVSAILLGTSAIFQIVSLFRVHRASFLSIASIILLISLSVILFMNKKTDLLCLTVLSLFSVIKAITMISQIRLAARNASLGFYTFHPLFSIAEFVLLVILFYYNLKAGQEIGTKDKHTNTVSRITALDKQTILFYSTISVLFLDLILSMFLRSFQPEEMFSYCAWFFLSCYAVSIDRRNYARTQFTTELILAISNGIMLVEASILLTGHEYGAPDRYGDYAIGITASELGMSSLVLIAMASLVLTAIALHTVCLMTSFYKDFDSYETWKMVLIVGGMFAIPMIEWAAFAMS